MGWLSLWVTLRLFQPSLFPVSTPIQLFPQPQVLGRLGSTGLEGRKEGRKRWRVVEGKERIDIDLGKKGSGTGLIREKGEWEYLASLHSKDTVFPVRSPAHQNCQCRILCSLVRLSPGWNRRGPWGNWSVASFSGVNFLKLWSEALGTLGVREFGYLLVPCP